MEGDDVVVLVMKLHERAAREELRLDFGREGLNHCRGGQH